jgi:hypothetical protein
MFKLISKPNKLNQQNVIKEKQELRKSYVRLWEVLPLSSVDSGTQILGTN